MGRCKYGQPIRTRIEEAREEARKALMLKERKLEEDFDEEREVEEDEDEGSEDEEGEEEGSREEGCADEGSNDEGSNFDEEREVEEDEDEEDEEEGSREEGCADEGSNDEGSNVDEEREVEEDEDEGREDEEGEEEGSNDEGSEDEGSNDEGFEDEGSDDEGFEDEGDKDKGLVADDKHWWTPSRLKPLKGKAVEPKVGDQRVVYAEGTNKGVHSNMTMSGLHVLARSFPWPEGVELRLPCANGGALANYPGCIVVYEDSLKAGFRLPLHPFIRDFLSLEKYCPGELTPNSWRCILAFLLKFKELKLIPSYEAYNKSLHKVCSTSGISRVYHQNANLMSLPSNPKSWGRKWFLVGQSEVFHFNFPMYPGDSRWCKGYTGKEDNKTIHAVLKFRKSVPGSNSKPSFKEVLTAHRLVAAGLSLPLPDIGSSVCEKYNSKRKREAACSSSDLNKMEDLSKKAKNSLSPFTSAVGKDNDEEEEEEEEDPLEDVEEEEEEEEEREDLASAGPQERPIEPASINSTCNLNGEKEVSPEGGIGVPLEEEVEEKELANARSQERHIEAASGRFSSFPTGSEWINSISSVFRPEVSTALRQLPELILAAQRSEQLERELDESRKENVELRRRETQFVDEIARKEREFQSRIERLEVDKKNVEEELIETHAKLTQTAQKALEMFDLASPSMKIKL